MSLVTSPMIAWVLLAVSGLLEILFTSSLHLSQGFTKPLPAASALFFGALSVYLMSLSLKFIPIGTAYVVWGGIGAVGTVLIGLLAFGESASLPRLACIGLIVAGTIGLQFTQGR
jgi:quaternary ammonium compound-resistance protein SugE